MQKVYSVKCFEKTFSDEVSKKAYLKACKWLAQYVYGNESYSRFVSTQVQKQESQKKERIVEVPLKNGKTKQKKEEYTVYSFKVILYFTVDFESAQQIFCNNCKQTTNTFFDTEPQCRTCKVMALIKKLQHETENTAKGLSISFSEVENVKEVSD